MARRLDKEKAIQLRLLGWSYSQIKKEIGVSKGTLSDWLFNLPLSNERLRELRDNSQIRIEKSRATKSLNRNKRLMEVYDQVVKEIKVLSDREIKLCGTFLYWAEGTKAERGLVAFSNTDPGMIKFFQRFLRVYEIPQSKIFVRLQLYKDMNIDEEIKFWSRELNLPFINFKKPYIKNSNLSDITYKNGFGHGTCSLMIYDIKFYDQLMMKIKFFKNPFN